MKKILLSLFILFMPVCLWSGGVLFDAGGVETGGGGPLISDDFSTDTSANYTNIANTMTVSGGAAHGQTFQATISYNNTSTASDDHYVQGDMEAGTNVNESSGLILKCNGTNYIFVAFKNGLIEMKDDGGNIAQSYNGSYTAGVYEVLVSVVGNNITIDVDSSEIMNYTNAFIGGMNGQYVGMYWQRGFVSQDVVVDNLEGDTN